MSIRQHRLDSLEKIKEKIGALKGTKITLVLSNNTAVLGKLKHVDTNEIILINGRLRQNRFNFKDIKELYFDQIV